MARKLHDMVVVITGASAGIGRQLATDLHARGARLVLSARRLELLHQLNQALDGAHLCVRCDVSIQEDCERLIGESVSRFGRIDTLVANAGFGVPAPLHEQAANDVEAMFRTNVYGTIDCARAAAKVMLAQPARDGFRGQIMTVSSGAARRGLPYMGVYSATKAAQLSLTEAMRIELEPDAIALTSVHPIGTETDFFTVAESLGRVKIQSAMRRSHRQSAAHVVRRMIRAIERPAREVWPHRLTRWAVALNALFPSIGDAVMRRQKREMDALKPR
jgi:short-subunit dehydrogenase